jgi:spore maturation protein CgeB
MKVLVLGKQGNITHWVEDAITGFRAAGHEVRLGITRNPALSRPIGRLLVSRALGVPRARWIERTIRSFRPDLILAIMPFVMPPALIERIAALPGRPPLFGWEGDLFHEADRLIADLLDVVAYTDSAFLPRHAELGFKARAVFLPHAATPRPIDRVPAPGTRRDRMVFVASVSPRRRALVAGLAEPIVLYGAGWRGLTAGGHEVHARRVSDGELARLYPAHLAALNITNEEHLLTGLNQRNFTPALSATPMLTDAQPDLERCFEPGSDVLVFRDAAELDALHARLRREPGFAEAVGQRGRARVLAEHGYGHRLATLAALL